jgi:hypothetical protein
MEMVPMHGHMTDRTRFCPTRQWKWFLCTDIQLQSGEAQSGGMAKRHREKRGPRFGKHFWKTWKTWKTLENIENIENMEIIFFVFFLKKRLGF